MATTYFRRFRMELNLRRLPNSEPELPPGYRWIAWRSGVVERHASVKYQSFRSEIDARVFACLGQSEGCRRLMTEISKQQNFVPLATWLMTFEGDECTPAADVGTIQGMRRSRTLGAVQNVGIVPEHRGRGLGRALVLKSLAGFRKAGARRVYLEVTAENIAAVQLYHSLGFRLTRTTYKAVTLETAETV